MISVGKSNYPNVIDAVRFHYIITKVPLAQHPQAFELNINQVYLDRLESFLKDEIDLPSFYAFVEGRKGTFRRHTGFPMAEKTLAFITESLEGKNHYETGPKIHAKITHYLANV